MATVGESILSLSRRETSPSYLSREELEEYSENPDRHLYIYALGRSDPIVELTEIGELDSADLTVLGFALTGVYEREAYGEVVNVSTEEILDLTPLTEADFPLSQFKVVVVDSDHAGKGIGSALTATALAPLFENPPVTAMLWERDNPSNVKLAERYANHRMTRFENYFSDDWQCPDCGFDRPCECAVTMYGWFADERRNFIGE